MRSNARVSKHWRPEGKIVHISTTRKERLRSPADIDRWARAVRYASPERPERQSEVTGTTIGVVLLAAACAGIAIGLNGVKERKVSFADNSTPVTTSFGYCYAGGGRNCVVDGDTFYLNGAKVRIAGIDAPETHPPRCADEARLGNEATEKLHALLNGGAVTMTNIDRDRDVYGRLLRNVAVGGQDVGEAMISAGVAREYGSGRRSWC